MRLTYHLVAVALTAAAAVGVITHKDKDHDNDFQKYAFQPNYSDVVVESRPLPRGGLQPNFNVLRLRTYALGLVLEGPRLGVESCIDNF